MTVPMHVMRAARGQPSIFFATTIIVIAFLPLFTMTGVPGRSLLDVADLRVCAEQTLLISVYPGADLVFAAADRPHQRAGRRSWNF